MDLLKALVSRVNRRHSIRTVRFWRSTWLVEITSGNGLPEMRSFRKMKNVQSSPLPKEVIAVKLMPGDQLVCSCGKLVGFIPIKKPSKMS